jgi:type IV pilus assembly protein PilB
LKNFNPLEYNISTLEDPVEYNIEYVNQSQIKPEIGYTFASGLRSLVRQDPDIIMV